MERLGKVHFYQLNIKPQTWLQKNELLACILEETGVRGQK